MRRRSPHPACLLLCFLAACAALPAAVSGDTRTRSPDKQDVTRQAGTCETVTTTAGAEAAARATRDSLAAAATPAANIPIPMNDHVLRYVNRFQTELRSTIEEGLVRGQQYLPMIQGVLRAEGLPIDLAYVPLIESAFKPAAVSHAQAKGVWQFTRGTAAAHGLTTDRVIDERADPGKATRAAARYLKTLRDRFAGDWLLALASYNGGPGRVARAVERAGTSDFWRLSGTARYLPRETREYVPKILAAIIVARNPARYGFEITDAGPTPHEKAALEGRRRPSPSAIGNPTYTK